MQASVYAPNVADPPKGGLQDDALQIPTPAFHAEAAQEGVWMYRHARNRLRVVLVPLPSNNVCALSIVFTVGSKSERTLMRGSAHIL